VNIKNKETNDLMDHWWFSYKFILTLKMT